MGTDTDPGRERLLVGAVLVLVGCRVGMVAGLRLGDVAAIALLPLTWPQIRRSRAVAALAGCLVAALACGLLLLLAAGQRPVHLSVTREVTAGLVAAVLAVPAVGLWARRVLPVHVVVALLATGSVLKDLATLTSVSNPWKFTLGPSVTVLVLALVARRPPWVQALASLALAISFMLHDARSSFGVLLVTAGTVALVPGLAALGRHVRILVPATVHLGLLGAGALAAYRVVITASASGWLGEAARLRTEAQVSTGEGLLAARPEAAAFLSLLRTSPLGFGPGVGPTRAELVAAMNGMSALGYQAQDNRYVSVYMFGRAIELHSMVGDLWAAFGPGGLLALGAVLALGLRALVRQVRHGQVDALTVALLAVVAWNVLFGPFGPMVTTVGALLLVSLTTPVPSPGGQGVVTARSSTSSVTGALARSEL